MEWENKTNIWKARQYSLTQRKTTLFLNSPSFNILKLKITQIKLLKTWNHESNLFKLKSIKCLILYKFVAQP